MKKRTIVVGDLHGCYAELMDLLSRIGVDEEDSIVSVGDLITKGPADREVLEFFRRRANAKAVLGNHENLLLRHHRGEAVALKPEHLRTVTELGTELDEWMDWISRLPLWIDLGECMIVHAGIRPGLALEKQTVGDLTELRTLDGAEPGSRRGKPWFDEYQGEKVVIFGHWVFESPLLRDRVIGIDTGCVYGGRLTAVLLPERRLVGVPARKAYARKG